MKASRTPFVSSLYSCILAASLLTVAMGCNTKVYGVDGLPSTGSPLVPAAEQLGSDPLVSPVRMQPHRQPPPIGDLTPRAAKTVVVGPILAGSLIRVGSLDPVMFDAELNEVITLRDALRCALANNLAIKISHESWVYQRYQLYSNMGLFLPTNAMNWNLVRSKVEPNNTVSRSRVFTETVRFPVFQGGSVLYGAIAQYYREKGWKKAADTTINDTLLTVYQNYTNLKLNRALLRIRIMAVQVSEAQLRLNEKLYLAGKGTRFAIMQSRSQLESDRQDLLEQQVAFRNSGLSLAFNLNYPMAINLIPAEDTVTEADLVDEQANSPNGLIAQAIRNRPELRQYELFALAANRTVQSSAAPLYPSMTLFPSYTHSSTSVSGGSAADVAGAGVFGGLFNTVQQGLVAASTLSGMGVPAAMNVTAAQALARQAMHQANQELLTVMQQVRLDYLSALTASKRINVAAAQVVAADEALRAARARLQIGVGTNLELIQAQRDYVSATIRHVRAIVDSNLAQAQILHDIGTISVDALTRVGPSSPGVPIPPPAT